MISLNLSEKKLDLDLFSDESKNIVKEYICFICKGVFNHPIWNDTCQHIFCKGCVSSILTETNSQNCPQCFNENKTTALDISCMTKPVNVLISLIEKQTISCKNLCGWKSTVKELKTHLASCPKTKIKCKNHGCSSEFNHDEKNEHEANCLFKVIECEKCGEKIFQKFKNSHIETECKNVSINCPNNCGETVLRKNLEIHRKSSCPNILMSCEFEIVGCMEKYLKKYEYSHFANFTDMHNELYLKYLTDSKENIETKIKSYDSVLEDVKKNISILEQKNQILNEIKKNKSNGVRKFTGRKQKRENEKSPMSEKSSIENKMQNDEEKKIRTQLVKEEKFYKTNRIMIKNVEDEFYSIKVDDKGINSDHVNPQYQFLMIDEKLNIKEKKFKLKIEVKKENLENWLGIGVVIKEVLDKNQLQVKNHFTEANHGFFGISSEGILYHNNSSYKNNTRLHNFQHFASQNMQIINFKLEYEYDKKLLKILIDDEYSHKIDMVFPIQPNMILLPCFIFKSKFEEMKIFLD